MSEKIDKYEKDLLDPEHLETDVMNFYGQKRDINETIDLSFENDVFPELPEPDDKGPDQA